MDPIRFAIDNPVKISVGVILMLLFGLISLTAIPVQLTPNVDTPVLAVTTRWSGATPQELENDVIKEQEDKLEVVSGLQKMTSRMQQGEASIRLEFDVGMDKDDAFQEIVEKLNQVPSYPDDVDQPEIDKSDPDNRDYIAWVIFSSSDPDFDIRTLQKFAEDNIKPALQRVDGVSEVNVLGGAEPEVLIRVNPMALAQHEISPAELARKLAAENENISAGDLEEGKTLPRIRSIGRPDRIEEIEQIIISEPGEPVVRVADVATAELGYQDPPAIVRSKGRLALAINAQREVGANVMSVMADYRRAIAELNAPGGVLDIHAKKLAAAGELKLELAYDASQDPNAAAAEPREKPLGLEQVYDQTIYIQKALELVRNNLFIGGALAITVLLIFLANIRATIIVGLAIPLSVIGTFVAMWLMGRNVNVISLAGLAFAVGMVVDNAIVVLENIDRHLRMGEKPQQAAYQATKEVWGAILASTLTTLAVFLPVLFIQAEAGQLFRDIALAICAAVTLSLIVSVMVIPVAANRFLKERKTQGDTEADCHSRLARIWLGMWRTPARMASGFVNLVTQTVYWLTGTVALRLAIIIVLSLAALLGSYVLMPPTSYLPTGNRNLVFAFIIPPPGYSLKQMETIALRVEEQVAPYWQAEPGSEAAANLPTVMAFDPSQGRPVEVQPPPITNFFFVGLRTGVMFSGAISADEHRVQQVQALLNNAVQGQPGLFGGARQMPLIRTGRSGGGIELEITGADLTELTPIAERAFFQLGQMFGFQNIRPDPGNFALPTPELQVRGDRVRAAEVGLSKAELGLITQMFGDGAIVGDFPIGDGDNVDMKIIAVQPEIAGEEYLSNAIIATPTGDTVSLSSIASITRSTGPQEIVRIEGNRAIRIEVTVPDDVPLDTAKQRIQQEVINPILATPGTPPGLRITQAGTAAKLTEVQQAMLGQWTGFNLASLQSLLFSRAFLAVLITFLLMAALFENWLYPMVILVTVPLATVGGFLGLRLVHEFVPSQQMDVLTMLGFVILIGVVVNNAILIVHQALNFIRGHATLGGEFVTLEPREAIRESVRSRIRPILMSMTTSIGGMLPLVLFAGAGSELYRGLGSVVVGGLLVSTVFTLLLVPLLLSLVFDLRAFVAKRIGAERYVAPA